MKRALSLSFLLLAGIVILAHAVIPHHHHNGISFLSDAAHPEHDDAHENCLMSKIYVKINNEKQKTQLHDFDFDLSPFVFADDAISQTKFSNYLAITQKPYLLFDYTELIARSAGLRAPPLQLRNMN